MDYGAAAERTIDSAEGLLFVVLVVATDPRTFVWKCIGALPVGGRDYVRRAGVRLISFIARFRRLTELACRPLRRNAEAYPISAMARLAAQSWHHRANRMDKLQYIGRSPQGHLRTLDSQ